MDKAKYSVSFYMRRSGRCPTEDFLDQLQRTDVVFVMKALERLAKHSHRKLNRPSVAYLRDDIYELRVNVQCGICRLFFFFYDGSKYVVTHGYSKKSDKVTDPEIDKAVEYRSDYLARKEGV